MCVHSGGDGGGGAALTASQGFARYIESFRLHMGSVLPCRFQDGKHHGRQQAFWLLDRLIDFAHVLVGMGTDSGS